MKNNGMTCFNTVVFDSVRFGQPCLWARWSWAADSWCCVCTAAGWSRTEWGPEHCSCWRRVWCFCRPQTAGSSVRRGPWEKSSPAGRASLSSGTERSWWRTPASQWWSSSRLYSSSLRPRLLGLRRPAREPVSFCSTAPRSLERARWSRDRSKWCRTGSMLRSALERWGRSTPCGCAGCRWRRTQTLERRERRRLPKRQRRPTTPAGVRLVWATPSSDGRCPCTAGSWCRWERRCFRAGCCRTGSEPSGRWSRRRASSLCWRSCIWVAEGNRRTGSPPPLDSACRFWSASERAGSPRSAGWWWSWAAVRGWRPGCRRMGGGCVWSPPCRCRKAEWRWNG